MSSGLQAILIVDDDPMIAEALAGALERRGREIFICGGIEAAQIVVECVAVDYVVADVRLSGPFRYEGLDFIGDVKRHVPLSDVILMTGAPSEALTYEAIARGARAVLAKPFGVPDLEAMITQPESDAEPRLTVIPSIDGIIASNELAPYFQPIVELVAGERAYGFESLARFERGGILGAPDALFGYASRTGRIVDVELACIRATFARCGSLTRSGAKIFINIHPAVIGSPRLTPTLDAMIATSGLAPSQIVLEITEQQSLGDARGVASQCAALRSRGFEFALDDVGVAYSHLTHIDAIAPTYLKVSQDFGESFELDATKIKIVRNILSLAHDFNCKLVLEGVETAATRDAARAEGIPLAQGFFFGKPVKGEA